MRRWAPIGLTAVGLLAAAALAGCGGNDHKEKHAEWSYHGKTGPAHWGSLDPAFKQCGSGKRQSPIDIQPTERKKPPPLRVSFRESKVTLENHGHDLEADYRPGSRITISGVTYPLTRFHFHAPSEDLVNGRHFPVEYHFVHENPDGSAAAVGVMVKKGKKNPAFEPLLHDLPQHEGDEDEVKRRLNAADLLPADPNDAARWSFEGSLTTPPCTEPVQWTVFRQPVEMSKGQIAKLTSVYEGNVRPVQPLNGRQVLFGR